MRCCCTTKHTKTPNSHPHPNPHPHTSHLTTIIVYFQPCCGDIQHSQSTQLQPPSQFSCPICQQFNLNPFDHNPHSILRRISVNLLDNYNSILYIKTSRLRHCVLIPKPTQTKNAKRKFAQWPRAHHQQSPPRIARISPSPSQPIPPPPPSLLCPPCTL